MIHGLYLLISNLISTLCNIYLSILVKTSFDVLRKTKILFYITRHLSQLCSKVNQFLMILSPHFFRIINSLLFQLFSLRGKKSIAIARKSYNFTLLSFLIIGKSIRCACLRCRSQSLSLAYRKLHVNLIWVIRHRVDRVDNK